MLIKALCDYYEVLKKENIICPKGYEKLEYDYLIGLTTNGDIDSVIDPIDNEESTNSKKSTIIKNVPKREKTTHRKAYVLDHRPAYLFGIYKYNKPILTNKDKEEIKNAKESRKKFTESEKSFLNGIDSPLVNAYRKFINKEEDYFLNNKKLLDIKNFNGGKYAFCLTGSPEKVLNDDEGIKEKWEKEYTQKNNTSEEDICAVYGTKKPMAKKHLNIKKLKGAKGSGACLVPNKIECAFSYMKTENSYSNISIEAMEKYVEAFNFLLKDKNHNWTFKDMTIIYWASSTNEKIDDIMSIFMGQNINKDRHDVEYDLKNNFEKTSKGKSPNINGIYETDSDVDYYIVGVKPNISRISVIFFYHNTVGDILNNINIHQNDMSLNDKKQNISIQNILNELYNEKISVNNINSSLVNKLLSSIINNTNYPIELLSMIIKRIKIDEIKDKKSKDSLSKRICIIKAILNRKNRFLNKEEEITMQLNENNNTAAYVCGRLFAICEKLQEEALGELNSNIRNRYFASACSKPSVVFPVILKLSQNHLNKFDDEEKWKLKYYDKLIQEVISKFTTSFPQTLNLDEQGIFMIGYYQQKQDFYKSKKEKEEE
ncbi:MAG: type I-C CRISPR-associated protein Cas8c/Csd1 [Eubacteriales bacterium]|nr:type I-C CRISPR-associated protein Cas8c/Csd1 [Eubacteriales bacterium]